MKRETAEKLGIVFAIFLAMFVALIPVICFVLVFAALIKFVFYM